MDKTCCKTPMIQYRQQSPSQQNVCPGQCTLLEPPPKPFSMNITLEILTLPFPPLNTPLIASTMSN